MAGRGTDIRLGDGVAELGGLYGIGTNRHESVRIDNQLRGRAGRQGDPGSSRFFVSYQDELLVKYGYPTAEALCESALNAVHALEDIGFTNMKVSLNKYERVVEGQRMAIHMRRQDLLDGVTPCESELDEARIINYDRRNVGEYLGAFGDLAPESTGYRFPVEHAILSNTFSNSVVSMPSGNT